MLTWELAKQVFYNPDYKERSTWSLLGRGRRSDMIGACTTSGGIEEEGDIPDLILLGESEVQTTY